MNYHETFQQMVDRKRQEMEVESHIVYNLTKMDWAIVLGLVGRALDSIAKDCEFNDDGESDRVAGKLAAQFGGRFDFGEFRICE